MIVPVAQMDSGVRNAVKINSVNYMTSTNSSIVNCMRGLNWRIDFTFYRYNTEVPAGPPHTWGCILGEYLTSAAYCYRGIFIDNSNTLFVSGATSSGYGYMLAYSGFLLEPFKVYECTVIRSGGTFTFTVNGVSNTVNNAYGTNDMIGDCDKSYIGKHWWNGVLYSATFSYAVWNLAFNKTATTKGTVIPVNEGTGTAIYNTSATQIYTLTNGGGAWAKYKVLTAQK